MKHHDHYHCPACAAEFASESDLERHEKRWHTQHGVGAAGPGDAAEAPPSEHQSTWKNKDFSRRNPE